MIRDIRWLGGGVCQAVGPAFDLDQVLEVMISMGRVFVNRYRMTDSEAVPSIFWYRDDGRIVGDAWLGEKSLAWIGSSFRAMAAKFYNVCDFTFIIRVGPLAAALRPLGVESLVKTPYGFRTDQRRAAENIELTPTIVFFNHEARGRLMSEKERRLVTNIVAPFAGQGVDFKVDPADGLVPPTCLARFPHARFGAGEGPLRIRCLE